MIELDLDRVTTCLIWELKILASIRCMCVAHRIEVGWCADLERDTAELLRSVRKVVHVKGNVLVVKQKSG